MVSAKLLLTLVLAIGATQAAHIAPQPRYLDVVLLDLVKIADIIITRVEDGLVAADPLLDEIQAELSEKLGAQVDQLRTDLKTIVANVIARVEVLQKEIVDGLATLESTIKTCLDAAEPPIDAELNKAEDTISDIITQIKADNQEGLTDLGDGIDSLTLRLDQATDKAIADSLACVVPGSTGVKTCLDTSTRTFIDTLKGLLAEAALLLTEANDVVGTVVGQFINATLPVINSTVDAIAPSLETLGACVEALPAPVKLY